MAGEPGIWLLYRKMVDGENGPQESLVGRFVIHGGNITIMEDHGGILEDIFPPGPMTERELHRMKALENGQSAYWELVREDDLNQGKRLDMVPEMDLGGESWPAGQE
jgi:hypothetical protein